MAALNGLSGILNIASSGLSTAQLGLNVTSNNIANVDTPGYNAAKMSTTSLGDGGVGVAQITATVNRYLQQASLVATSSASQYSASASNFSSAQNLFGDPSSSSNLFSQLNSVFSSFSTLAASNTSTAQSAAVSSISSFLNNASSISQGLDSLQNATDSQIKSDVTTVNSLLQNISDLNTQISEGSVGVNDTTSLQNQQAEDVTQLSQYMNITVTPGTGLTGTGVTIRAGDGTPLTTPGFAPAVFAYTQANGQNQLTFTPPGGTSQPYGTRLSSGELQGLLVSRNTDIPGIAAQLSQLTSSAAQALNTASNAHTSVPAPTTLTGQPLGMDVASAVGTFTGKTSLNIVNSAGVVQNSLSIDFTAGTITPAGGAATSFTPSTFVSTMNTVLGGLTGATATVSTNTAGNALNFAATGTNGLVFSDDATTPASSGGQNFSQYFGLNNVVSSSILSNYNTGLSAASTSGYTSGAITFSLTAPNGGVAKTISFTPPATGTVGGLVSALNNATTGLGAYGSFSLSTDGALTFTPTAGSNLALGVASDTTAWKGTGAPLSQLFGLDPNYAADRAQNLAVTASIVQTPSTLQSATFNQSATGGTAAILIGDTSGLDALAKSGQASVAIAGAGALPASTQSVSAYASAVSGQIGQAASAAQTNQTSAQAVATEASSRLSTADGVNLDSELINLTTYQQAYSASARLVTAANAMYQTLLDMVP